MTELKIFNLCRAEHWAIHITFSYTHTNQLNPGIFNGELD